MQPEIIFQNLDGFKTEIYVFNPGRNKVLIGFHGFAGSANTFSSITGYLPDDVSFYSVALPWHGNTTCGETGKRLDIQTYAQSLAGWIKSLTNKPVDLLAHSFGARICSALVAFKPELARQLFYIAPGGFYPWEDYIFSIMATQPFRYLSRYDFFIKPYVKFMVPGLKPAKVEKVIIALQKTGWSYPAISPRKTGVLQELGKFNGQLWLIMGEKDHLLPFSYSPKIKAYWKNAVVVPFENSGHLPMVDHPKKLGQFLREKLQ